MDNLTHTFFAATLARTPLGRAGRGTTVALLLASNAPDIDIVATAGGGLKYLEWHRGPSHGLPGVVGLGLVTAGLVWMGQRIVDRTGGPDDAPFWTLTGVSTLGVLLHVLMDLPTPYGTRLFSPLEWHWYALDLMPIIDIYLLVALAAGLLSAGRSESARARNATIVLVLMAANYGLRFAAHERALNLAPDVFGSRLPARCDDSSPTWRFFYRWPRPEPATRADAAPRSCLVALAALPAFTTPFDWRLVAQLSDEYQLSDVNVLAEALRALTPLADPATRVAMRAPNHWTPAVFAAAKTEVGRLFLGFARFPAAHTVVDREGVTSVRWNELRFTSGPSTTGQRTRRDNFFSATVLIDRAGQAIEQRQGW
jgi:membrane-bound metal-dependent hydrolase YbcI (DUF457 family)